jgi:hypothetical protein
VNAAFLLVTTAWVAGAEAPADQKQAAPPAQTAPAPVYSVGAGCSGCGGCDSCGCGCGYESEGLFSKLKGLFHRGGGDCGCGCESHTSHFGGFGHHKSDCGCASCGSSCDACDSCGGHGGGFRERLRGLFHRGGDCGCGCDTGCGGCGGCGGVLTPIPGGTMPKEQIGAPKEEQPKKLPSGDNKPAPEKEKKPGSVQLIPQPAGTPDLELAPSSGKSPF